MRARFSGGAFQMKHRNSHFAVGYWSRIRNGRPAPDQGDVDPKALKRLLPFVFLLDARGGVFTYRLAGTTLCERYGSELRGRDFLYQWDSDSRTRLNALLRRSLQLALPVCLTSIGATDDCHMIEIETVLMPISFGGTYPERFLGVAQVLTDVSPLAGQAISFERLVSSSLVHEDEPAKEDAPPSPPPSDRGRPHPRAPHLRLVAVRESARGEKDPLRMDENAIKALFDFFQKPGRSALDSF
jgi:hypothetical protein